MNERLKELVESAEDRFRATARTGSYLPANELAAGELAYQLAVEIRKVTEANV